MFTLHETLAAALEETLLRLDVFDLRKCIGCGEGCINCTSTSE